MRIALTIAGFGFRGRGRHPGDLKTFHQFGVYGTTAITAVTAQNTLGVSPAGAAAALVAKQIDALAEDLRPAAIKTGSWGPRNRGGGRRTHCASSSHDLRARPRDGGNVRRPGLLDRDAEKLIARGSRHSRSS